MPWPERCVPNLKVMVFKSQLISQCMVGFSETFYIIHYKWDFNNFLESDFDWGLIILIGPWIEVAYFWSFLLDVILLALTKEPGTPR